MVFAGELLREAEKLIDDKIHPMVILDGWRLAQNAAREALEASAVDHSVRTGGVGDAQGNPEVFYEDLLNIARTTLSSKLVNRDKDHFGRTGECVRRSAAGGGRGAADPRFGEPGLHPDSAEAGRLAAGLVPGGRLSAGEVVRRGAEARVGAPEDPGGEHVDGQRQDQGGGWARARGQINSTRVRVDSIAKVGEIEEAEKAKMRAKVAKILAHGMDVFISRQLIYNYPEQLLTDAGVGSIEHADFEGVERLAAVLGGGREGGA